MTAPATPDDIRIFQYTYNAATDTYTQIGGSLAYKPIAGTATTVGPDFRGGAWTVSIDKDSSGRLWVVWPQGTQVRYSFSDDNGETWSAAAQVPAQAANSINFETLSRSDSASVIAFGSPTKDTVGVMWSDQDDLPAADGQRLLLRDHRRRGRPDPGRQLDAPSSCPSSRTSPTTRPTTTST